MMQFRSREIASDACAICGVPAATACRNPLTAVTYPSLTHDIPLAIVETEKQSILDDMAAFSLRAGLVFSSGKKAKKSTANATPLILLDELLPAQNGAVVYAEGLVGAAVTPGLGEFRMWRQAAILARTAGTWAVLGGAGGVASLPVPPASAGASGWVAAFSLPGSDTLRLTVTGAAATTIGWVGSITITPF